MTLLRAVGRWAYAVWRRLLDFFRPVAQFCRGACKEIADVWSTHFWQ